MPHTGAATSVFVLAVVLTLVTAFAGASGSARAESRVVCSEPEMHAYELRFVEMTTIESADVPVGAQVPLDSPRLDKDALADLAASFRGEQPTGLAWGYLLAVAPGESLDFHGDVPAPWGRRFSILGGPESDASRHRLTIESGDFVVQLEIEDGQTKAFVIGERRRTRVVAVLTAGPCGVVGLTGDAAGPCALNAHGGVDPPTLIQPPATKAAGTHRYVNFNLSGRGLMRFVVTSEGTVTDILVMLERTSAADVARALAASLSGRAYTPARLAGQPVDYCVVDVIAPFGTFSPRSAVPGS